MASSARLQELRAEARYRRERRDLYGAQTYSGRPTSLARLRELECAYKGAKARLHRAGQERPSHNRD
jgi:hypothetical protein